MLVEYSGNPDLIVEKTEKKEMASVRTLEDGRRHVRVNSSSLSLFQECWRKSYYLLRRGLVSKHENEATLFGSAIHAALEVFYEGKSSERVIPTNFTKTMELWAAGQEPEEKEDYLVYGATEAFLKVASPLQSLETHNKRSIATGLWLLQHYFETYIDDPYTVFVDKEGPITERSGSFILFEDDEIVLESFGTIDVVLKHENTGSVLVCDHKTSSVVGQQFYNRLKPNHQYTGYLLLAREAFGIETDKFLVNCLEVKPKPKTSRGKGPNLPRQVTTRTEEDFTEYRKTMVYYAKQLVSLWDKPEEEWVLGPVNACASYAGCQFLKTCSSPKQLRENIIGAEFNA